MNDGQLYSMKILDDNSREDKVKVLILSVPNEYPATWKGRRLWVKKGPEGIDSFSLSDVMKDRTFIYDADSFHQYLRRQNPSAFKKIDARLENTLGNYLIEIAGESVNRDDEDLDDSKENSIPLE